MATLNTGLPDEAHEEPKKLPETPRALLDDIRTAPSLPDLIINDADSLHPSLSPENNDSVDFADRSDANESDALSLKTPDELNWSDWEELLGYRKLFDWDEMRLFRLAETKRDEYPDGFDNGNYFESLPLIIASKFTRAEKIVCCGNQINGYKVPCDQWTLCSKCAYMRGVQAVQMYEGTFQKASFYHVTLGFDGDIPFDVTNSPDAASYWKTNQAAIADLLTHRLIEGAYLTHELKIRNLYPLRVNPHSHVIVTATKFPDEVKSALQDMIAGSAGVNLIPSIEVKLIDSREYHDRCFRYLTKPIDLEGPYLTAWNNHCSKDRSMAPALNLSMRVFLDAHAAAFGGIEKVVRMGNLMPQRKKDFIGVPAKDRTKKKQRKRSGRR